MFIDFLSICYFALPEISNAQSEWTESECIRYAIEHNLQIQNKKLDTKIANTDIIAAYGNFYLQLVLSVYWESSLDIP